MISAKRFNGQIITKNRFILDQLCESDGVWVWSGKGHFTSYIKKEYNLTPKEYYNIVVFNDINYRKICPVCKLNEVEFIKISKGYRDFCSNRCVSNAPKTIINRFLSYNYKVARLYICEVVGRPDIMKFGITGVTKYNSRQNYRGLYLKNHIYIMQGTPEKLIHIEDYIKQKYCNGLEFFDSGRLPEILECVERLRK